MAVEVVVKKLGNSIGVIFPKNIVKEKQIEVNKKVFIEIVKEADLGNMFGSLKRKINSQKFKDMVRQGWV
ncbi:MAG TPA: hypothetical protein DCE80_18460 [Ignavibacteriales bacterium]|nr:hypothetical protein [Candidatus Woesearchaeota archaeon]HAB54133.1 hypothetical protein [Ignavibacteriales bacterium]